MHFAKEFWVNYIRFTMLFLLLFLKQAIHYQLEKVSLKFNIIPLFRSLFFIPDSHGAVLHS